MINKNDIVTVVTSVGELIGRLIDQNDVEITVENPRSIMMTEGGAGFAPGICMTGERDPAKISISKSHVVFLTKTSEAVSKAWIQQTSGIIT